MAAKVTTGERRGIIAVMVILAAAALILALRGGGGVATAEMPDAPTAAAIDSAATSWTPDSIAQKAPADSAKRKKKAKTKPAPKPNEPKPSPLLNPNNRISLNNTLITNVSR